MESNPESFGPGPGQARELNLQKMAGQFMAGVQRHFDHLAFSLAARDLAQEARYTERVRAPGIMPAPPFHQNFEQMQAYTLDLLTRQILGDALNLAVAALNNAHIFLALVKQKQTAGSLTLEAQKAAQEAQQAFLRAPIDQKFNTLEEQYHVMCPLEDTITSMGFAMQALMQQGGIVRAPQLDAQGELSFELKSAKDIAAVTEIGSSADRFGTRVKTFREGESVVFSELELQLFLITIAAFADQLFTSVARYARDAGAEQG